MRCFLGVDRCLQGKMISAMEREKTEGYVVSGLVKESVPHFYSFYLERGDKSKRHG